MSDLVIPLPWTTPPVSLNARQHHHVKAKAVAQALTEARWAIRAAKVPRVVGAEVTLHYRVPDNRRRDADNLAGTLKVCQDALVQEGVLPDDSWVSVPSATCRIHAPDEKPALWLELTDVTAYEAGA